MALLVNTLAKQNRVGATNMDKTLADYIRRVQQQDQKPIPEPDKNPDDYKVYPEIKGDEDHKRNPYSPV